MLTLTEPLVAMPIKRKRQVSIYIKVIVALLIVTYGVSLRLAHLTDKRFWVDEAESTINALTILQHGYPTDHYLGLPLFENTLTEPWPGHPEYEFKDTSYSDRGMAVYHAWLPLYSIAMSLKTFDIHPNEVPTPLRVQRTPEEMDRMQFAARLPSVVFSGLLLVVMFAGGWMLFGEDAAWATLIAGAASKRLIELSQDARYYSATVLFGTLCSVMIWRIWRRGKWVDYLVGGIAFALLFHTHIVTFLIACVTLTAFLPFLPRTRNTLVRLGAFAAIVLSATLPWLLVTGFLTHTNRIPKAYQYLQFPSDLYALPSTRPHLTAVLVVGILLMIIAGVITYLDARGERRWAKAYATWASFRDRFSGALEGRKSGLPVLIVWVAVSYAAFILFMPAISYNLVRIKLPMSGPGLILCGIVVAILVRMMLRRPSIVVATCAMVALLAPFRSLTATPLTGYDDEVNNINAAIDWLSGKTFRPDTRFYALPNQHLQVAVYTGLPFQCVAPVRKAFLDEYPGPIVLIDSVLPDTPFGTDKVRALANAAGVTLDDREAKALSLRVAVHALYSRQAPRVATLGPTLSPDDLPSYLIPLVSAQPGYTADVMLHGPKNPALRWPTIFRDYPVTDRAMWWQVYFYRFSDPLARSGPHLNYAERIRSANASILDSGWTVYDCPPRKPQTDTTSPSSHMFATD